MHRPRLWAALRYAELNPFRARMVEDPTDYPWSSAAAHCGLAAPVPWLDARLFSDEWNPESWRRYLSRRETEEGIEVIRRSTHTGRPLGDANFVAQMEKALKRRLAPRKGGRPPKETPDARQQFLTFGAD